MKCVRNKHGGAPAAPCLSGLGPGDSAAPRLLARRPERRSARPENRSRTAAREAEGTRKPVRN